MFVSWVYSLYHAQYALHKHRSQNLLGDNHGPPLGFTLHGQESVFAWSKKHDGLHTWSTLRGRSQNLLGDDGPPTGSTLQIGESVSAWRWWRES